MQQENGYLFFLTFYISFGNWGRFVGGKKNKRMYLASKLAIKVGRTPRKYHLNERSRAEKGKIKKTKTKCRWPNLEKKRKHTERSKNRQSMID